MANKVHGNLMDLTGQRYGTLTVLERAPNSRANRVRWRCRCDCGKEVIVQTNSIRSGNTESCGCYYKKLRKANAYGTMPEYKAYRIIKEMCRRSQNRPHRYGSTPLRLHPRWRNFRKFLADVGPRPSPAHRLVRIDKTYHYYPGNLIWIDE